MITTPGDSSRGDRGSASPAVLLAGGASAQGRHSVAASLAIVGARAPTPLVPPRALRHLCAVTRSLPAALTGWYYLECRLAADAPSVDLVIEVGPPGRAILAGRAPGARLPGTLQAHRSWDRIRALCAAWDSPGSRLAGKAHSLWLEFDAHPNGDGTPDPGVFVNLEGVPIRPSLRSWLAAVRAILSMLLGGTVPVRLMAQLATTVVALPEHVTVAYVGLMMQRPNPTIRLCLQGLAPAEHAAVLRETGWPGDVAGLGGELARLVDPAGPADPPLHTGAALVHLDVGEDGVQPRLGFEYLLDRRAQLDGRLDEPRFLDRLVTMGLCTTTKRAALGAWPGYSRLTFPHERWTSVLVRRVNHVKIVACPGHPLEAKAYLSASAHRVDAPPAPAC